MTGTPRRPARSAGYRSRTAPVTPPIYQSATFMLDDQSYKDIQDGGLHEHWYGRFRNPTVDAAAEEVADLERGEAAIMTSSGMAAIATTLLTLLRAGDSVVAARQVYGDTRDLFVRDLSRLGIEVTMVDATDLSAWRAAVAEARPAVVYAETLSNPQLELTDLSAVADLAQRAGARLVVDNTFATPFAVTPLTVGADVVVQSATKFLGGHSDVIAGAVVGAADTVAEVQRRMVTFGGCLDPHAAFLVWRGLQTFDVRLERSCATALAVAAHLRDSPHVSSVRYPGLDCYPQRELAERLLRSKRSGAMVACTVRGGDRRALEVMRRLTIAREATSLGGVETLVSTPFNSSHFSLSPEERLAARIDDGMIRLSCGLEDADALVEDLDRALRETEGIGP